MRGTWITMVMLAVLLIATARSEDARIRPFDLETLQKLGTELYTRDQLASRATDLMIEAYPDCRQMSIRGWVSEIQEAGSTVYFIRERNDITSLAYTVFFPKAGKPKVKDQVGEAVPPAVRARFLARRTAFAAVPGFYTPKTNGEVVDDPDGKGLIVYVLASTDEPGQVVVGGHYRVMVSADGRTAKQVDALSRSLLIVPLHPSDLPKDSTPASVVVSHIVSDTPVETHVFVSLLHGIPIYVATAKDVVWRVDKGTITKVQDGK